MIGDNAIDPRQSQPAMPVFRREERFKDPRQIGWLDPTTIVFNLNTNVRSRRQRSGPVIGRFGQFQVAGLNADLASPAVQRFDSILQDFDKRLLQFGFIKRRAVEPAFKLQRPNDAFPIWGLKELDRSAKQGGQVACRTQPFRFVLEAEKRELVRYFGSLLSCLFDFRERDPPWRSRLYLRQD